MATLNWNECVCGTCPNFNKESCRVDLVENTEEFYSFITLYEGYLIYKPIFDARDVPNFNTYWVPQIWKLVEEIVASSPYDMEDYIEAYHMHFGYS
jgi:hypothetical protein